MDHAARRKGFTLIELLIFAFIFLIVVPAVIVMFVSAVNVQSHQTSENETETQGQFLIQNINYYVQSARIVGMPPDAGTSTLTLRESVASSSFDPTVISLSGGTVYLTQGAGTAQPLTSNRMTVTNLSFTRRYQLATSSAYGTDSVSYSFTMTANASKATQKFSQTFSSSVAVAAPVPKITLVQSASTSTSGLLLPYTAIKAAFGSANATSALLVAVVSAQSAAVTTTISLSDTIGGSWTTSTWTWYGAYGQTLGIYYKIASTTVATDTVSLSFSTGTGSGGAVSNPVLFAYEYRNNASGCLPNCTSTLDAVASTTVSGTYTPSSGPVTPANAVPELVLGALYSNPSSETPKPGTGFTLESSSSVGAVYVEDMTTFVTGAVSAGWTYSSGAVSSSVMMATFK